MNSSFSLMKVKIKYVTLEIAKHFGSKEKEEEIEFPKGSLYKDLISNLARRSDLKDENKILDTFFFLVGGKSITLMTEEKIDPNEEVVITYADFGG